MERADAAALLERDSISGIESDRRGCAGSGRSDHRGRAGTNPRGQVRCASGSSAFAGQWTACTGAFAAVGTADPAVGDTGTSGRADGELVLAGGAALVGFDSAAGGPSIRVRVWRCGKS